MSSLVFVWIISKTTSVVTVSPFAKSLNSELQKQPPECTRYIVKQLARKERNLQVSLLLIIFFSFCYGKQISCLHMYMEGTEREDENFQEGGRVSVLLPVAMPMGLLLCQLCLAC